MRCALCFGIWIILCSRAFWVGQLWGFLAGPLATWSGS